MLRNKNIQLNRGQGFFMASPIASLADLGGVRPPTSLFRSPELGDLFIMAHKYFGELPGYMYGTHPSRGTGYYLLAKSPSTNRNTGIERGNSGKNVERSSSSSRFTGNSNYEKNSFMTSNSNDARRPEELDNILRKLRMGQLRNKMSMLT